MTTATLNRIAAPIVMRLPRTPAFGAAPWTVEGLRAWLRRRVVFARTLNELDALSDRDLVDLGFVRCDLRRIAAEAAARA